MGKQVALVIILELPVLWHSREEGWFVPDLRQLHVIASQLRRALAIGHGRVDAGRRRLLRWHPRRHEVHGRQACELGKPLLHFPILLWAVVRPRLLDRPVNVAGLRVRNFDLLPRPERPLHPLHSSSAGRPRVMWISARQVLWRALDRTQSGNLLALRDTETSRPRRCTCYRDPVARLPQRLRHPHLQRISQMLLDGLLESPGERIVVGRIVDAWDGLCAHQVMQLAR
mmetsp:Transcript_48700/g.136217  ORF Transcript_48700/g.136217 Transcript_48700/m.136217 type:complete len:228 (-) Transcript_48700:607-1290(-)